MRRVKENYLKGESEKSFEISWIGKKNWDCFDGEKTFRKQKQVKRAREAREETGENHPKTD